VGKEEAGAMPKATIGGALLGAELVIAVEAAIDVDPWWWYAVGGGLGAVGGGVGGYFIDRTDNPEVSMSLLVGGMVFAVPATLAMVNARTFKPEQNPVVDSASQSAAQRAEDRYYLAAHRPIPSLVDVRDQGKLSLRVPAVSVAPVFSQEARQMHSLPTAMSVRVPVFHLSF
jgi:hypothetical protein